MRALHCLAISFAILGSIACEDAVPAGGVPDAMVGGGKPDAAGSGGNDDAAGSGGHNDAAGSGGNDDAAGSGGNDDAAGSGGDDDAAGSGGDDDAAGSGGDDDAAGSGGDDDAAGSGGDEDAAGSGGDEDAAGSGGDEDAAGSDDDASIGPSADAAPAFADASGSDRDGGPAADASATSPDASTTTSRDASATASDGGATNDGGQLGQPLPDFCAGNGAVVDVGGGMCSGNIAQQTFRFALCTCDSMELQSNIQVDAFDSTLGAYGAATPSGPNILEDGHVGVNGQLAVGGMMDVLGSVFVSGGGFSVGQRSSISVNVYANGDAVQTNSFSEVGRNMFIDGNVVGRYDINQSLYVPRTATVSAATLANLGGALVRGPISPITPCPCGPSELLDIQAIIDYGRTVNDNRTIGVITSTTWATGLGPDVITLPCGRYYLTEIQHPRGITVRAEGRTVLYVDGDFIVGGGLRIELATGAELDMFISGSLQLQSASRLGDESRPSAVRTYIAGNAPIVLSASTLFGGNVYAPRADVTFNASADLYGALFANSVLFSGSASVHFDHAIRSAGQACSGDAGVGADAGAGDSGVLAADSGVPAADSGVPAADSGLVGDAGARDAGAMVSDAGVRDSGTGSPDAAPAPCTQCFQCGNQACIFPPSSGTGTCGACTSDLDCCATNICNNGACVPSF